MGQVADLVSAWGIELNTLLAGLIGALSVFMLTTYRDWRREGRSIKRERNGLLRLTDMEIYQNVDKLEMMKDSPDIGQRYRAYSELHTSQWEESKSRLAQLLPTDHLGVLVRYYGLLDKIGAHVGDEGTPSPRYVTRKPKVKKARTVARAERENLLSVLSREGLEIGGKARELGSKYIGELEDYFDLYDDDQDEETEDADNT